MSKFYSQIGLTYNDIGIVPSLGKVKSRSEIPLEGYRIVVAGMSSIIGEEFLKAWARVPKEYRPTLHIPRDKNSIKHLKLISEWGLQDWVFVGVGLNTIDIEDFALENGYTKILIDIAFGGLPQLKDTISRIRIKFGNKAIICTGSISTEEQANYLDDLGVDIFRANIGSGNVCSTKYQSGIFVGSATELRNVYEYIEGREDRLLLADGGIHHCGDFVKAFLLGASYVQSGFVFTKCKEAQMHIDGSHLYYGESSKKLGLRAGKTQYDESLRENIKSDNLFSLQEILEKIWGGIRSGLSYSGFSSLDEAIGNGEFIILNTPLDNCDSWNI